MNAIAADNDGCLDRRQCLCLVINKMSCYMVIMQIHLGTAGISNNGIISEALTNGLQKDHLQITAMNGKLRPIVTSRHPGGLAINELAKAVEKYGFFGTYADWIQ